MLLKMPAISNLHVYIVLFLIGYGMTDANILTPLKDEDVVNDGRAYATMTTTTIVSLVSSRATLFTTTGLTPVTIDQLTSILRDGSNNATVIAETLSMYSDLLNNIIWPSSANLLTASEIDQLVVGLDNINISRDTNTSLMMAIPPHDYIPGSIIVGGVFNRRASGQPIMDSLASMYANSNISVGALFSAASLATATSINILTFDRAPFYENLDPSNYQRLASSVVVVGLRTNTSVSSPVNISLYFQVFDDFKSSTIGGSFNCSWFNFQSQKWNSTGCSEPLAQLIPDQYECQCTHLSTYALIWSPRVCANPNETQAVNGTCVPKSDAQIDAVTILRNMTNNGTTIANALSVYISSISNTSVMAGDNGTLSIQEIDHYLGNITTDIGIIHNTTESILIAQRPNSVTNNRVVGVSFRQDIGGDLITESNQEPILQSKFSAAAVISDISWTTISTLNMLVIGNPTSFTNIDRSSNKTLASSIVLASLTGPNVDPDRFKISLYFTPLQSFEEQISGNYGCYFVDTTTNKWDSKGCTLPTYNVDWDRYECTCNHLTSFALLWLPQKATNSSSKPSLDAQDIASLVFQSISIACFLIVLIHALVSRWNDPLLKFTTYDILPMLSTLSTTILFIFYIALGMTVYTQTPDTSQTKCSHNASALMFIVYFLLIFMFGIKTSVAYFNYLRFVVLFPEPSLRRLNLLLIISFAIAIIFVSFAAGFNSNPSFHITQLYDAKLCWFTRDVLYYFLTIPVCVFLLLSVLSMVLVGRRIVNHVRQAGSSDHMYERMKRCVIVLLSSSVSQGLAWLLGPFLSVANPEAGRVLGWFFVILIGLEGLWSILLYLIILWKRMHMTESAKYIKDQKEVNKSEPSRKSTMEETDEIDLNLMETYNMSRTNSKRSTEKPVLFHDLCEERTISFPPDVEVYGNEI